MRYKNTKTGFVFESPCEIKADGWECLDHQPEQEKETKKSAKRAVKK